MKKLYKKYKKVSQTKSNQDFGFAHMSCFNIVNTKTFALYEAFRLDMFINGLLFYLKSGVICCVKYKPVGLFSSFQLAIKVL